MWSLHASTCFVSRNQHFSELKSAVSVPTVLTVPTVPICTYVCTDCTPAVPMSVPTVPRLYIYICTDCILALPIFVHRLYLSVLQLYHRLLTVEQTHKINKVVTLSLSLSLSLSFSLLHTYHLIKSVLICMFYASAVNKIGRFIPRLLSSHRQQLTFFERFFLNFIVIHVY